MVKIVCTKKLCVMVWSMGRSTSAEHHKIHSEKNIHSQTGGAHKCRPCCAHLIPKRVSEWSRCLQPSRLVYKLKVVEKRRRLQSA